MKFVCTIFKTVVVLTVIAGGAVVASTVVLGKERVRDLANTAKLYAEQGADNLIDSRVNAERKVEQARAAFAGRIALIEAALREAESQAATIENDKQAALDVAALCEKDIAALKPAIVNGTVSADPASAVSYKGTIYTPTEAQALLSRAIATRDSYTARAADLGVELAVAQGRVAHARRELELARKDQSDFELEARAVMHELEQVERNHKLIELRKRGALRAGQNADASAVKQMSELRESLARQRKAQETELGRTGSAGGEQ